MILKAFAPFLVAILFLWVVSRLIVSEADRDRQASEKEGGWLEFAPNRRSFVGIWLFVACMAYLALSVVIGGIGSAGGAVTVVLIVGFVLLLLAVFPSTILLNNDGLQQLFWLSKKRSIAWAEVKSVAVDEKKHRVTVFSRSGTKIVHTKMLPEQDRFLGELRKHCGDKVPGETPAQLVAGK